MDNETRSRSIGGRRLGFLRLMTRFLQQPEDLLDVGTDDADGFVPSVDPGTDLLRGIRKGRTHHRAHGLGKRTGQGIGMEEGPADEE